jgi:hypothetical protein
VERQSFYFFLSMKGRVFTGSQNCGIWWTEQSPRSKSMPSLFKPAELPIVAECIPAGRGSLWAQTKRHYWRSQPRILSRFVDQLVTAQHEKVMKLSSHLMKYHLFSLRHVSKIHNI